jgi:hypothetical protein
MAVLRGYELILGTAALISLLIVGIEVAGYCPECIIPRESICIQPQVPGGPLAGYPDALILTTGTDAGTARLSRLRAGIDPEGIPETIDLDFYAEKDGMSRLYQLSYRGDTDSCGWLDGLTYPEKAGMTPDSLPVDMGRALAAIGQLRFPDLAGRYLVLETGPLPVLVTGTDDQVLPSLFVFENGTPADPKAAGPGGISLLPFSLMVSERSCTPVQVRDTQCSTVQLMRILFVDAC